MTEGARHKVLLVDDNQPLLTYLRRILTPEYDVYTATTVSEAENVMALQDIHVLVCDHLLPGESGLDFCRRLHANRMACVRVMISGHAEQQLLASAINSRALFRFLIKPFEPLELLQTVQDAAAEYDRSQSSLRQRAAAEALLLRRDTRLRRVGRIGQMIFGLGSFALATMVVVVLAGGGLALVALLVIYLVKSWLGIDIFQDTHLSDLF